MDYLKVKTIDELIEALQLIKLEYGNLPTYSEYDSSFTDQISIEVCTEYSEDYKEKKKVIIIR